MESTGPDTSASPPNIIHETPAPQPPTLSAHNQQHTANIQKLSDLLTQTGLPPLHPALLFSGLAKEDNLSSRQVNALESIFVIFCAEYARRGSMIQDLIRRVSEAEERINTGNNNQHYRENDNDNKGKTSDPEVISDMVYMYEGKLELLRKELVNTK